MTATVIIATIGSKHLSDAIDSVLAQTYPTKCLVVCDGKQYSGKVSTIISDRAGNKNLQACYLPENVGANGFYGHRIYASFPHLVNTDYVLYLDHDNWFDVNHVKNCIENIENNNLDWCYSLRKIYNNNSEFICRDDCESLGKWPTFTGGHLIDTSCYCIKTSILTRISQLWNMGWGADRVFAQTLIQHVPNFNCTKEYSTNYRVDGNQGSVNSDFFLQGNQVMTSKYNGVFPWNES